MSIHLRSILCLLCLALTVAACDAIGTVTDENADPDADAPSDSASTAAVVNHYAGPGSRWDVKLREDNTFEVTVQDSAEGAANVTVQGTYEELPSGYLSMTVESSSGEDGPAPGDRALGLEIPGFAFVLHPLDDSEDDLHMMVSAGTCPDAPMDGNWVMMKDHENVPATAPDAAFFGTFDFDLTEQFADIPQLYALSEFNPVSETTEPTQDARCEDGVFSVPDATMYVTASGLVTGGLSTNDHDGYDKFIFGVPNERTEGLDAITGTYTGLAYAGHDDPAERVFPVGLTCDGGQCRGAEVVDLSTGAQSEETVELAFEPPNMPELGVLRGVIAHSETTNPDGTAPTRPSHVACAASTQVLDTDHKMLACVGMSPENPEHTFSMLLRSTIE